MDARERRAVASEAAAEWWLRLQNEAMPAFEREQFVDWLRESPLHVGEMLRMAQVHDSLAQFQRWTGIATGSSQAALPDAAAEENVVQLRPQPQIPPIQTKGPFKRARIAGLAAAIVAVAFAAAWFIHGLGWQTIETDRGERREVALADGSVLQVGPQTRLRVRFTEQQRNIILDQGATLFRVAKNPRRPFIVEMNQTLVRAVGTAFGVEQRGYAVVVTVAEGKVAVQHETAAQRSGNEAAPLISGPSLEQSGAPRIALTAPDQPLILLAGQQVSVPGTGRIGSVRKVDSERELAWASGRLVFEQAAISEVIEAFNRYNRVQLTVADPALGLRHISGVFDASDPESFIAFLASVTPVRVVRRDAGSIELTPATGPTEKVITDSSR